MEQKGESLRFQVNNISPTFCKASVVMNTDLFSKVYNAAIEAQKKSAIAYGFAKESIPSEYIKQNFAYNITKYLQEFLFNYFVLGFLYKQIHKNKLHMVGGPRIADIVIDPENNASFHFDINTHPQIELQNWKYFPFKAPKRKNYKDLDRQVESFIKEERTNLKDVNDPSIQIDDWISFSVAAVDEKTKPLFAPYQEQLWLKLGNEEADKEFQHLFLGKKSGDQFFSSEDCIQEYFGSQLGANHTFLISINNVLHNKYFCFDAFKKQFRLKTKKEMCKQLIEVFSYRNDLSQRQAMVEETFKLMLSKYKFTVPNYLILRQQQQVIGNMQTNPDYHVYRTQKNFENHIKTLAEKQLKETILIDQIAIKENIMASDDDIATYLNLTKRPRMKDFIHFTFPETKIDGQESPISAELIRQPCLREKTLNYIIYYLTRK